MALPELNQQLREYADEVRAKTHVDDVRREFNLDMTTRYGLRFQAQPGTDVERAVETVVHLLGCVQRSFNTFRIRCRLWYRKVKIVARVMRSWCGLKQRRVALLYSAWLEWERAEVERIRQQHPHRPAGEIAKRIEEQLVSPAPGQRHRCVLLVYEGLRRRFHTQFIDWHARRRHLQTQVRSLTKQAVAEKVERVQAALARDELLAVEQKLEASGVTTRRVESPRRASASSEAGSARSRLEHCGLELAQCLMQEPKFDVQGTADNIRLLVDVARQQAAGASDAELTEFTACSLSASSHSSAKLPRSPRRSSHAAGSPARGMRGSALGLTGAISADDGGDFGLHGRSTSFTLATSPTNRRESVRGGARVDTGLRRGSRSLPNSPTPRRTSMADSGLRGSISSPTSGPRRASLSASLNDSARPSSPAARQAVSPSHGSRREPVITQRKHTQQRKLMDSDPHFGELRPAGGDDDSGGREEHHDPGRKVPARLGGKAAAPELDALLASQSGGSGSRKRPGAGQPSPRGAVPPLGRMLPSYAEDPADDSGNPGSSRVQGKKVLSPLRTPL